MMTTLIPRLFLCLALVLVAACEPSFEYTAAEAKRRLISNGWPEYGGGQGQRFFRDAIVNKDNVHALELAWVYRTGDVSDGSNPDIGSTTAFQVTPITADDQLVFCTPFNRVIALDPVTGGELWAFDPEIDLSGNYGNQLICRGVTYWRAPAAAGSCSARIFTATNDGFLIAIDSRTGRICEGFGTEGRVNLNKGPGEQQWLGEYQITSAPAVISNLVIVGSAISDNVRTDAPSGVIRAFDALTGQQRWAFDLAPPGFDYKDGLISEEGFALGTPNVWGTMSVDPERDLLFVPTGNPSPDYYREGERNMDYYGSAVIAIRASTGEVVWHFKTVIKDFWDYDVGAQPTLSEITIDGEIIPVVIQATKMGFVFVLHRETGKPVIDVEYKTVPTEGPLADKLSKVQPFPPPAFQVASEVDADDEWKLISLVTDECSDMFAESRTGPIYTPITEQWTIVAPSNAGGINWGGIAVDPDRGLIATRASNLPFRVRLVPREKFTRQVGAEFGIESAEQRGQPYAMNRMPFTTTHPIPCIEPPWGNVTVIEIESASQKWRKPHGTLRDVTDYPVMLPWGVPGMGGPFLTDSGLLFLAGGFENAIRAYDVDTGAQLWHHRLPAGPQATPMTYTVNLAGEEKQFVIIAAGGHGRMGTKLGDYIVAFSLP